MLRRWYDQWWSRWLSLTPLAKDAVLYIASGMYALGMGVTSRESAQWRWGYLAFGPYLLAGLIAIVLRRRPRFGGHSTRVVLFLIVLFGATVAPLVLEVRWRHIDGGSAFAQPEVGVIERSGQQLSKGTSPYTSYVKNGQVVDRVVGIPAYESFFPYFPLMGVFGLPSAETHRGTGLTDARIVMTLLTMIASLWGLSLWRISGSHKLRAAQVLLVFPTGALFLATGGDDMPILALCLLGVAALERKRVNLAGASLGIAAAMKLTAWPIAVGTLLASYNEAGVRRWKQIAIWLVAIVGVTVLPFAIRRPHAFLSNVFAFPLGLAHIASPAASPLPGHILTTWWPPLGHVLAPLAVLVSGYFVARYLRHHWPVDLRHVLVGLAILFAVMICSASATRIGYLIYPLNLWLWATMCDDHQRGLDRA
jgi:Glycosyltransferase family 87